VESNNVARVGGCQPDVAVFVVNKRPALVDGDVRLDARVLPSAKDVNDLPMFQLGVSTTYLLIVFAVESLMRSKIAFRNVNHGDGVPWLDS
jgi:hypothetical protein